MTNVQGQQQAYNALDAVLHGVLLGDEARCCAPSGLTPSSLLAFSWLAQLYVHICSN